MTSNNELFHPVITLPDETRKNRYARLVGLDDVKAQLRKEAAVLADPTALSRWAAKHHPEITANNQAFTLLRDRAPLLLFTGDVGSGKSALAESFGCDLAEVLDVDVTLFRLKLTARGTGHVGEMTTLIGEAFEKVTKEAKLGRGTDGKLLSVTILVIDEADALVQSREATQMHHEDRAGVDAFLAGIDDFAGSGIPLLVVMCTNRLAALDPAVKRRAAAIFEFRRPNDDQRRQVLINAFAGFDLDDETIDKLVLATGERGEGRHGFTYSDLTQRLVPTAILMAYPDNAITADLVLAVAEDLMPTPPFNDKAAS
ncbi:MULTISPECIES: AAA family ATPase [Rhodococcus erythropolis group]|uniref:AAA family ATPase n=1 Tax=Rhodococcus erythropolis group TaxID=2840174 RepID=UPI0001A22D39|nr:ATP-binding protein [Rhodococcus qingshengii]EEN88968.1 ATPase, AAA family [Rhodococcus erythropolis SK121]MCQ4152209.1 ATP-binding protein [Rhodococcus qingshengii]